MYCPCGLELVFIAGHPLDEGVDLIDIPQNCLCLAHPDVGELSEVVEVVIHVRLVEVIDESLVHFCG